MPRYYNQQGLGLTYQSAYDPSFDNNLINLQNQEGQKASMSVAALAERNAQIGDVFSYDTKGKAEVVNSFKDKVDQVKQIYNNDLALAAPALASAIAKERQNPWYQKNALYNQQLERKQKLDDQFGPNILYNKELQQVGPDKSLNDMEMEDIGFDYVNLQHVKQILGDQFGALSQKRTDLGMKDIGNGFVAFGNRTGLSESELNKLKSGNPQFLDSILNQSGIEATDKTRATLMDYVGNWMDTTLVAKDDWKEVADPFYKLKLAAKLKAEGSSNGRFGLPTGMQVNSKNSNAENITGAKSMPELISKSKTDGYFKAVLDKALSVMPEPLRKKLLSFPTVSENDPLIKSIPNFNKLSNDQKQAFFSDLNDISASYSDRSYVNEKLISKNALIGDLLIKHGLAMPRNTNNKTGILSSTEDVFGLSGTILGTNSPNFSLGSSKVYDIKQESDLVSKFSDYINKYDKWYDTEYASIKDEVNKYLTDENLISFSTNTVSGRTPKIQNDINNTVYTTIKSAGTDEMTITDEKGNKANSKLSEMLESGAKVSFVNIDLGSEYSDNKFRVSVDKGTGEKRSSADFYITPNTENLKEFSYNLAVSADSFGPLDAVYSKLLHEKTFKTGKDIVTINDIRSANVYNQGLPQDNNPTAYIKKAKDGSFIVVNKDLVQQGTTDKYYEQSYATMTQASDGLLEQYGISPEYKVRYIHDKLMLLQSPKEKKEFLRSQLSLNNITEDQISQAGYDESLEEDYAN